MKPAAQQQRAVGCFVVGIAHVVLVWWPGNTVRWSDISTLGSARGNNGYDAKFPQLVPFKINVKYVDEEYIIKTFCFH